MHALTQADLLKNEYYKDRTYINNGILHLPDQLSGAISVLKNRLANADNKSEAVNLFYVDFKTAYEEKNDSLPMSCLSDGWEAGDGTTPFDVETN